MFFFFLFFFLDGLGAFLTLTIFWVFCLIGYCVQEALEKWSKIKDQNKNLKLHFVGKLQTNKVKFILPLFDYIHSLDSEKLANELSKRQKEKGKNLNYFIQVNLGSEEQREE